MLTGAGISAESGVPTFRGSGGLWRQFQATVCFTSMNRIRIHHCFSKGFSDTFSFCTFTITCLGILSLSSRTCSNKTTKSSTEICSSSIDFDGIFQGHFALAQAEKRFKEQGKRFDIITQNVDGLHKRAGSENVIEMHGEIRLSSINLFSF